MKLYKKCGLLILTFSLMLTGAPISAAGYVSDFFDGVLSDVSSVSAAAAKPTGLVVSIKKKSSKEVTVNCSWSSSADYYDVVLSYSTPTGAKGKLSGTVGENSLSYDFDQQEGINYTYTLKVTGRGSDGSKSAAAKKTNKYRLNGSATKKVKKVIKNNIKASWSDYKKVKYVHDWMVKNISYDENLSNFTFSDAILKKSAVCQGYSETFMVFMELLGIPVKYVPSVEQGNHAWNLVKVSGKWYHVDVTWDDPAGMDFITDNYPVYDYFLQSTKSFQSKATQNGYEHQYTASKYPKCTTTTYDNSGSTEEYWEALPGDTSGTMYNNTFKVWKNGVAK